MTGDDLKQLLLAGADGCETVRDAMRPEVCDFLLQILQMIRSGELYSEPSNGAGRYRLRSGPKVDLDKIVSILGTVRDWGAKGNFTAMAASMRNFSERWRILGFIANRIK